MEKMEVDGGASGAQRPADLYGDLRKFVAGASGRVQVEPPVLAHLALSLLKSLLAARDAVLEYFCTLFDAAVSHYFKQLEQKDGGAGGGGGTQEEATISEIHAVLCGYVGCNTESWAPIISTWSLQLLGVLSSKYASQRHVGGGGGSQSLNETLHLWMSCRATRTLVDLNTQCLTCLMHSNTDACISALLETSVAHSPHFDWVVAHVGSAFPHTVINRVLSCGLRDYCRNQAPSTAKAAAKVNSVVGILGHLAASHLADIRAALLHLFQWSMEERCDGGDKMESLQRVATVPYLIQLASLSPTLLQALSTDVLHSLDCAVLRKTCDYATDWCSYLGSRHKLQQMVVSLALHCKTGGDHMFRLLLDAAHDPYKPLSNNAWEILELILCEMGAQLRCRSSVALPLLACVQRNVGKLRPLLLATAEPLRAHTVTSLLALLGWQDWGLVSGSLSYLLLNADGDAQLAPLLRLLACRGADDGLDRALAAALTSRWPCYTADPLHLWTNVEKLLRWDVSSAVAAHAVARSLDGTARCLAYRPGQHRVARVLLTATAAATDRLPAHTALWCVEATLRYMFHTLRNDEGVVRARGCRVACRLLARLSVSPPARAAALRGLVETALDSPLFGNTATTNADCAQPPPVSLLKDNLNQTPGTLMAQKHLSVFHAGVIGFGLRSAPAGPCVSAVAARANMRQLVAAISACCGPDDSDPLALLLVELISPDVMYNGLPWPEDDFCKVTVERDLQIANRLWSSPAVWALLGAVVAGRRPALCYCSVLLRAAHAHLAARWLSSAQQGPDARAPPDLVARTQLLLQTMAIGQLLPPPLDAVTLAVPHLPPSQVVVLLRESVWNYMRDHVPSPALFSSVAGSGTGGTTVWRDPALAAPAKQYTDPFRLILQRNVATCGQLYAQLFLLRPPAEP